jgi:predicted  nucleic acid-binding Zn-ribbon protein
MWRLRRKTERGWNDGFHINTRDEAEGLCELLNKLEREVAEAKEQCSNLDDQVSSAMMVIRGLERERDRLAEALRELWDNHTLHGAAYELIENTLAAVKGGQS